MNAVTNILFILLILLLGGTTLPAQGLTIQRGTQQRTFKPDSYFEIHHTNDQSITLAGCEYCSAATGRIIGIGKDSITLSVYEWLSQKEVKGIVIKNETLSKDGNLVRSIAKSNIYSLRNYNKRKQMNNNVVRKGIGGLLIGSGLITALNTIWVHQNPGRKNVWIAAGVQIGVGTLLLSLPGRKKYYFKDKEPVWKIKE